MGVINSCPTTIIHLHCMTLTGELKPGPHQQQCRSNNVECCLDNVAVFGNNVEATFDFVAKNDNNVERDCVEISSFRQGRMLLRHCCPKRQHCRSNRQQSNKVACCFNNVASTLLLVWTGLKLTAPETISRSRDMVGAHQNLNGLHDLTTPFSGMVCHP